MTRVTNVQGYPRLGFRIGGVEDGHDPVPARPWDVLLRLAAGDPSWRELAHPATLDVYDRYRLDACPPRRAAAAEHLDRPVNRAEPGYAGRMTLSQRRLSRVDRHLERAVRDLLAHDDRVRGLDVRADFAGGVAHLTGKVGSPAPLVTLRALVGELAGVFAVWSRVRVAGVAPVLLDLGCGATKQYPESIGVDRRRTGTVDVLSDVGRGLPFASGTVDAIFAVHVLEHLFDFLPLVDECHRVLRPTGTLHLMSPWWGHVNAVADPTHVRLFDVQTVKGICDRPGTPRWRTLHAACDGASVFADLRPLPPGAPDPDPVELARFFD